MSLTRMLRDLNQAIDKGCMSHESATIELTEWARHNMTGGLETEEASKLLTDDRK